MNVDIQLDRIIISDGDNSHSISEETLWNNGEMWICLENVR